MRTRIAGLRIATMGAALAAMGLGAGTAQAQQMHRGAGYPMPGRAPAMRPIPGGGHLAPGAIPRQGGQWRHGGGQRWQMQGGRWTGGWNAPGGWNGYRQPVIGWNLPEYWVQPGFAIDNWAGYGLASPPAGYTWSRYYDDAVLIDGRGAVYDTVSGVDWDRSVDDYAYQDEAPVADYGQEPRRSGLGGAAVGAVAGGVAGNLIAGRGNRLGGTLIGAGVGGAAGYAIDRSRNPRRGAGYPVPAYDTGGGYAQGGYAGGPVGSGGYVSPDGRTVVTTSGGGGYWGGGTTTVVVQSAPVVTTTTTTTEYYDDVVTYRPAKRKVWRRPTKTICRC